MGTINRIMSAALGLLLLMAGAAVAITMVVIATGRQPTFLALNRWYDWLRGTRLEDGRFLTIAAISALIGLVLTVLELRPWPPDRVLTGAATGTPVWISRRSLERRLDASAARAGVERAHSRVHGRPGRWRLRLRGVARPECHGMVGDSIRTELDRLYAPPDTPIRLALRRPPRRER
jgi:hypothetical protein